MARELRRLRQGLCHLLLLVGCAFALIPILWVAVSSLEPESRLYQSPPEWLPLKPDFSNFDYVFSATSILHSILNSTLIAGATAVVTVLLGALAAYSFARYHFPLRNQLFLILLGTQMIPTLTNIIPLYLIVSNFHLIDSALGLVIVYIAANLPLAIWILAGFFRSLPTEIEESALIDGCNALQVFYRIALPLTLPGLAAVAILTFVMAWNEFVVALTFISSDSLKTYQLVLYDL